MTVKDNTVLKDTSLDNLIINNDLTVNGVVKGQLKDANGYKYVKIKTGTINDNYFTNISFLMYDNKRATVNAVYTINALKDIDSLGSYTILLSNPTAIKDIKTIQVLNKDDNFNFIVSAFKKSDSQFNFILRNISGSQANINGLSFDLIFDCYIDDTNTAIKFD